MYAQSQATSDQEKELILQVKEGNEQAFEKIYRLYSVRILKKLVRLIKDEEIAAEILQDVFLKLWEKRGALESAQSLKPYLFRIAENKVTDIFRRATYDKKLMAHLIAVSTELCNSTEETLYFKEGESLLQQAINILPPQRQKVFMLCKLEGRSYDEVAGMLGISPGTVNDHMVKAGRAVKSYFHAADLALLAMLAASVVATFIP